jgi:predicted RND superfamily exporter protein
LTESSPAPVSVPLSMHAPTPSSAPLGDLTSFDRHSGSLVERALFNHRGIVLVLCLLLTGLLGIQATRLKLNASFEKMMPGSHPYVVNYLKFRSELSGLGNAVRIAVVTRGESIYDAAYLQTLQQLNDEVFLLPGVDRTFMKSLWTPSTRWVGVTEEGLEGGPVIPESYTGSPESIQALRRNVERSGQIGQLVARDLRSTMLYVPLLARTPDGQPLDYVSLSRQLEQLRVRYGNAGNVEIHITGFAKVAGDLIEGLQQILLFFGAALAITAAMLYAYTRCARSTVLVVACSLIAVVWQLGLLPLLGYPLDPYSVLVPFLVFAIGMSHGAQKMNGIMQDVGRGMHKAVAARFTFRRLFLAGLMALLCDAVGFAVLMTIRIRVIQDLALIASLGVAVLIFTNLILLPILLSYIGVSPAAARRSLREERAEAQGDVPPRLWRLLDRFTRRRWAMATLGASALLAVGAFLVSLNLKIGDLDPGAPELRADSRYNRDAAYITAHYGASADVLAVMVRTPDQGCSDVATLLTVDQLEWSLGQLQGVESTHSLARLNRSVSIGLNEGNPKWYDVINSQTMANTITAGAPRGLYNEYCNLLTVYAYLTDNKADTLTRVVDTVEQFARRHDTANVQFLLAAGNAGIEAATNIVVRQANREMLVYVYGAVLLLCWLTFGSWRAVVCAVLPLLLTSILCEALMVFLGIGVKVATLPVIALGVGIGVDYALYVMSILLNRMREGDTLSQAYRQALRFTGKVVLLTGLTLAAGVATWALSPIRFQADMGILLAFMFVWNMVGALVLLPALAHFMLPREHFARRQTPPPAREDAPRSAHTAWRAPA